jgi:pyruvate dehydrogenase E2 component (dihydrolipoamide acetyltransferase)
MKQIIMPKLGLTMEEGILIRWHKLEGEIVSKGELLFEVETEKSTNEVVAADSGVLGKILLTAGETANVLEVIGYLLEDGEQPPERWPEPTTLTIEIAREGVSSEGGFEAVPELTAAPTPASRNISPRARRLADEKGISIDGIRGSGPGGRIVEQDVLEYINSSNVFLPSRLQQITAERMAFSFTTIPHFYLKVDVDASNLVQQREVLLPNLNRANGVNLTYTDLLIFFVARALKHHPLLNASWENGRIRLYPEINIGLAVEVKDGLVVPVLKQADQKTIHELTIERQELVKRAIQGQLTLGDLEGGTFTLSNLGMFGIDEFVAIINPPQSAILAVGKIQERVIPKNSQVVIKPYFRLNLSVDHRVLDGVVAAKFLMDLKNSIEIPTDVN